MSIVAWTIAILAVLWFVYGVLSDNARADERDTLLHEEDASIESDGFLRSLNGILGNPFIAGNDCRLFQNGDQIFPAMLEAIGEARESVHFATYVYWRGEIARRVAGTLADAARRGVEVRVILDWFGAYKINKELIRRMREAGCDVRFFRPPTWYSLPELNRRTHRRLLIIDGRLGFTGGVGIADEWTGNAQDDDHWRDVHARFEGPIVRSLQGAFLDNWSECSGDLLIGDRYFPHLDPAGDVTMCVVQSDPSGGTSEAKRFLAATIQTSIRSILITNSYFVPSRPFVEALCDASSRRVQVRVLMPGDKIDRAYVRAASRHTWGALLEAGVELYEYQPTMLHAKTMVVDDFLCAIGSVNFDPRSFALNDECTVVLADRAIADEMQRVFAEDLARARRVDHEEWKSRPFWIKLGDRAAYFIRGQL